MVVGSEAGPWAGGWFREGTMGGGTGGVQERHKGGGFRGWSMGGVVLGRGPWVVGRGVFRGGTRGGGVQRRVHGRVLV